MNELALFAGAGGGILGGHLLGWRTVCAVEFDAYARNVLLARQRDGWLPRFPIWDDVRTFDGKPWRGRVDVVSGGFPCQDISAAGKGAGIKGKRSGLWREMARIIGEVRPDYVWVENSPMLVGRGLAVVLGDLAEMGYDARWGIVGADDACAPHRRKRIWILADSKRVRELQPQRSIGDERGRACDRCEAVADSNRLRFHDMHEGGAGGSQGQESASHGRERWSVAQPSGGSHAANPVCNRGEARISGPEPRQEGQSGEPFDGHSGSPGTGGWWQSEPQLGRVADGLAAGLDVHGTHAGIDVGRVATGIPKRAHRLRCIGNGQVPAAMTLAWNELTKP